MQSGSLGVLLLITAIILSGYALTDQCHGTASGCAQNRELIKTEAAADSGDGARDYYLLKTKDG